MPDLPWDYLIPYIVLLVIVSAALMDLNEARIRAGLKPLPQRNEHPTMNLDPIWTLPVEMHAASRRISDAELDEYHEWIMAGKDPQTQRLFKLFADGPPASIRILGHQYDLHSEDADES